jgi:hypothetical protein
MNNKFRTVDIKTLRNVTGGAGNWSQDWNKTAAPPAQSWSTGNQSWWKA